MKKWIAIFLAAIMLALPVCANEGDFTPSVSQKHAPVILPTPGTDGIPVYDENGVLIDVIPVVNARVISYLDRASVSQEIRLALEEAYDSIANAATLAEAMPLLEQTLAETLKKLEEAGKAPDVSVEDLIARDLFYVDLDAVAQKIISEGETAGITFGVDLAQEDMLLVLRRLPAQVMDDSESWIGRAWNSLRKLFTGETEEDALAWVPVDPAMIEANGSGSRTVRLEKVDNNIGVLVFVTVKAE